MAKKRKVKLPGPPDYLNMDLMVRFKFKEYPYVFRWHPGSRLVFVFRDGDAKHAVCAMPVEGKKANKKNAMEAGRAYVRYVTGKIRVGKR